MKTAKKIVITGILAVLVLVMLFTFNDKVFAENSVDIYHILITQEGKLTRNHVGSISYTVVGNQLYKFDSTTTSGIPYYLNQYNSTKTDLYNTNNSNMTLNTSNGSYIAVAAEGTPSYINIYSEYFTITYNLNGGVQSSNNREAFYKNASTFNLHDPTRQNYIFGGWYRTENFENSSVSSINPSNETDNITLFAKWFEIKDLNVYTLETDNYNINQTLVDTCSYHFNDKINSYRYDSKISTLLGLYQKEILNVLSPSGDPLTITTSSGYTFSSAAYGSPDKIVLFNPYYKINYVLNDGSIENAINYYKTVDDLSLIPNATKENHVFNGWYLNQELTEPFSPNNNFELRDITLYANFSEIFTIPVIRNYTDLYNAYSEIVDYVDVYQSHRTNQYIYSDNLTSKKDEFNSQLSVVDSENNTITMSTSNGRYISFLSQPAPNKVILTNPYYKINYVLNDGSIENAINYYETVDDLSLIPNATKENHVFNGWYLNQELTEPFSPNNNFELRDITLYASFSEIFSIPVIRNYTDLYNAYSEIVDYVDVYQSHRTNQYIYSDNLTSKKEEFNSQLSVVDSENNTITMGTSNGRYISFLSQPAPNKVILTNPYYSITYNIETNLLPDTYIKYYCNKSQLNDLLPTPTKENYIFLGWALDENLTSSYMNSSFNETNITLYPRFSEKHYIDVIYYNDTINNGVYENVGTTYYYKYLDSFYCYGSFDNHTEQLGYYLKKYDTTSFEVLDANENILECTTNNGKMLSIISEQEPSSVRIYRHYTTKFYVNGHCVSLHSGKPGDSIIQPDFIVGFIGKNYEAISMGNITIGNRYAIYLFENWSFTDTSDKTWFDKTEVEFISDWTYQEDKIYVKSIFAYMKFYSKLSEKNKNIDYEKFISETNGIITTVSDYTVDDLLQEHATLISSDTQLTLGDKISRALNLDKENSFVVLLEKLLSNKTMSLSELWNNLSGRIVIIVFASLSLLSIIYILLCLNQKLKKLNNS